MKKVLIVTASFYPQNSPRSFRATELAKELGRQGHQVIILTKENEFDYSDFEMKYSCKVRSELVINKYNPSLFMTRRSLFRRIIDRFLYQFFLYPEIEISVTIYKLLTKAEESFDLIISIAKPYAVHIGCALAKKRNRNLTETWVADCGDPFTLCKSNIYDFPFYIKYLEKFLFRQATYITLPVRSAMEAYFQEFRPKMRIIPQGFNFSEIKLSEDPVNNPYPTFCYAGALYRNTRDPRNLLDYLSTLDIKYKFIVYTTTYELVEPYQEKMNGKLEIRKPIPREKLLFVLSKMDFLVNIDNVYKEQVPSKIIDYAIAGRPILNIEPQTTDYKNIHSFLNGDYSAQLKIDNINDYDISLVVKKFLELTE